jgi:hypothetical protein
MGLGQSVQFSTLAQRGRNDRAACFLCIPECQGTLVLKFIALEPLDFGPWTPVPWTYELGTLVPCPIFKPTPGARFYIRTICPLQKSQWRWVSCLGFVPYSFHCRTLHLFAFRRRLRRQHERPEPGWPRPRKAKRLFRLLGSFDAVCFRNLIAPTLSTLFTRRQDFYTPMPLPGRSLPASRASAE